MDQEKIKKNDIIRALRVSPSNEKVVMYEKGKASDIAVKLTKLRSKQVAVIVIE